MEQNDMKVFAEATLGNTVDNSKRAGFIKYDRNVLRFQAVWDDRESLYGDIQRFEVGMLFGRNGDTSMPVSLRLMLHETTKGAKIFIGDRVVGCVRLVRGDQRRFRWTPNVSYTPREYTHLDCFRDVSLYHI